MAYSISNPELLTITDEETGKKYFGGVQNWFSTEWSRRAGCGPTSAAIVTAYLAHTRPELRALYAYGGMTKREFAMHMEEVYRFVTPGIRGMNRAEMYSEGVREFAKSRGVALRPRVFFVEGNRNKNRPPVEEFLQFAIEGLKSDCPLGFLVLTRGRVKELQYWHWVTITEAEETDKGLMVTASDEGEAIRFNLRMWYQTTRLNGGLVYFTRGEK